MSHRHLSARERFAIEQLLLFGLGLCEAGQVVEEFWIAGLVDGRELFQEQVPKQAREDAHGQEETGRQETQRPAP